MDLLKTEGAINSACMVCVCERLVWRTDRNKSCMLKCQTEFVFGPSIKASDTKQFKQLLE